MSVFAKSTKKPDWALRKDGTDLLSVTSFLSASVTSGGSVVSAPVEEGSFTSYNKTADPLAVKLEAAFQGTKNELQTILQSLDTLKESTDTFSIVTPYSEFEDMTLASFQYELRTENGIGVLYVTMDCEEVKEVAAAYSSVSAEAIQANQAANASDASMVSTGQTATAALSNSEATQASASSTAASRRRTLLRQGRDSLTGES